MTLELAADPVLGRLADAVLIPPFPGGREPGWLRTALAEGMAGVTLYGSSKAGLSQFTSGLRQELRGTPVATTLVQIGGVKTDMVDNVRGFGPTRRVIERSERWRMMPRDDLEPELVANAIADAVEHQRRYVTLPRRIRTTVMMTELPRRLSEIMTIGIDMSKDEPR